MTVYELNHKAFNLPKQRKHDAIKALEDLARSFDVNTPEGRRIAAAYHYFTGTLPKPKKAKTTFDWIARAADYTNTRSNYSMSSVAVDNTYMVATNGHRLHLAPTDDRPYGFYHPKTGQQVSDNIETFPNYIRVIPTYEFTDTIHIKDVNDLEAESDSYRTSVISESGTTFYVNKKYLLDACDNASTEITFKATTPDRPIVVDHPDGRRAVIMPMQPPKK